MEFGRITVGGYIVEMGRGGRGGSKGGVLRMILRF